jgi:hypothetical protein
MMQRMDYSNVGHEVVTWLQILIAKFDEAILELEFESKEFAEKYLHARRHESRMLLRQKDAVFAVRLCLLCASCSGPCGCSVAVAVALIFVPARAGSHRAVCMVQRDEIVLHSRKGVGIERKSNFFKSSARKNDKSLSAMATNLHLQVFTVEERLLADGECGYGRNAGQRGGGGSGGGGVAGGGSGSNVASSSPPNLAHHHPSPRGLSERLIPAASTRSLLGTGLARDVAKPLLASAADSDVVSEAGTPVLAAPRPVQEPHSTLRPSERRMSLQPQALVSMLQAARKPKTSLTSFAPMSGGALRTPAQMLQEFSVTSAANAKKSLTSIAQVRDATLRCVACCEAARAWIDCVCVTAPRFHAFAVGCASISPRVNQATVAGAVRGATQLLCHGVARVVAVVLRRPCVAAEPPHVCVHEHDGGGGCGCWPRQHRRRGLGV